MQVGSNSKMVIVLDESLSVGLQANTAAVLSLTLGNKISGLIGKDLLDKSKKIHTGLTIVPLPILICSNKKLRELYSKAYDLQDQLLLVDITDAAQTTKTYADYEQKLQSVSSDTIVLLGIALFGEKKNINSLTGSLGLLR